jgi:3-dehydroquinate dehydratase I
MKIKYCLPILKKQKVEVIQMIEKNKNDYHYFEIWLDYIQDIDENFIIYVIEKLQDRVIFLFHRGAFSGVELTKEKKISLISLLDNTNAILDLDISETKELDFVQEKKINIKRIISYHNYHKTPDTQEIETILEQMEMHKPEIYKIATMCREENDTLKLLELLVSLKKKNKKAIIIGMGKFGTITRVYGTMWGNELAYAPKTLEEASAPGQLTKQTMEKIIEMLTTNH